MNLFKQISWPLSCLILLSFSAYAYTAYFLDRADFDLLLLCYFSAFAAYCYMLCFNKETFSLSFYLRLGFLFRLLFLFSFPRLSDDYFRFLWDGQLLNLGINPFDFKPSEVGLHFPDKTTLLAGMNSPDYYSIYPPIAQYVFAYASALSPNSILGSIVLLRLPILLAEAGSIFLLPKLLRLLKMPAKKSLIYVLNPLVIIELSGNLHFEAIMIFFLLLGLYFILLNKIKWSALAWSLAAASKLLPLIFLPIFLRKYPIKKVIVFYTLTMLFFLIWWMPFFKENFLAHFFTSFQLYFSTFEFNAGIYTLLKSIGEYFVGYNPIQTVGPWLSRMATIGVLLVLLWKKNPTWTGILNQMLLALSLYYVLALVVHPWYISMLVFLAVFSRFTFPILWSALVFLSYSAYQTTTYQEHYLLIALEYALLFSWMLLELRHKPIDLQGRWSKREKRHINH